jgi:peroxiredoxin
MQHLVGCRVPDVELPSTQGGTINLARLPGRSIVYCYPYTGRPGVADPPGWDDIPGAHGSTPQSLGYAGAYQDFLKLNMNIFGVSMQPPDWQAEFASRAGLPFALLSDAEGSWSAALALPRFTAGSRAFLARLTLELNAGLVTRCRHPVPQPAMDATDSLAWQA